ncbi:MAG: hypothetical protein DHS20C21_05910 [Gemmatimonadota bacterium]|nr:MAG: hypothetical protein DHS20C21_05910 [Gemmatimonadota bacterium]
MLPFSSRTGHGPLAGRPGVPLVALAIGLTLSAVAWADFDDVSTSAGITETEFTYGAAWNDIDGDGDLDLFTGRHFRPPLIYLNQGNGTFDTTQTKLLFDPGDHHGAVLADFDNDGDADIYISAGAVGGAGGVDNFFYRNDGNLSFVDIAASAGLTDPLGRGRSCSVMDVDRDGTLDLFVAKGKRVGYPNSLYLNNGFGVFTDVAAAAGMDDDNGSVGGIWGDYDRDGDADLFVSGEEDPASVSHLYRNDGNASFTDVTSTEIPGGIGPVAAAAWADFDRDGDLDLAVGYGDEALFDAVDGDSDSLSFFMNTREGENGIDGFDFSSSGSAITFDLFVEGEYDASRIFIGAAGVNPGGTSPFTMSPGSAQGMPTFTPGVSVGLYIWADGNTWKVRGSSPAGIGTNFGGFLTTNGWMGTPSTSDFEPYTPGPRGTRLYENTTSGFVDRTSQYQLNDTVNVRHLTWVDYDKDGDQDLHVLAKGDTKNQNEQDILYRNRITRFTDETGSQDAEGPIFGLGDGCAWDDYDGDGDLDVAILSGAPPRLFTLQEIDRLYKNDSNSRGWLRVHLVGTISNRDGFGSWVTCISPRPGPQHQYVAGNAWRGSQVSTDVYFGLYSDHSVDTLRVEWPSGIVSVLTDVPEGHVTVYETETPVGAPIAANAWSHDFRVRPVPSRGPVVFTLPEHRGGTGVLEVFDSSGRRVLKRAVEANAREAAWATRDATGGRLAAGVYYALFRSDDAVAKTKVVLLR